MKTIEEIRQHLVLGQLEFSHHAFKRTIKRNISEAEIRTEITMFHCHVCGSTKSREDFVDEVFHLDGKHVLVEHIPAKICVRCGEKTFSRETTEKIRQLVHSETEPARAIPMDVFEYA